jgi:glyoxylase-like metal-dependent hydrolase (beta-lactamase superfamily II)
MPFPSDHFTAVEAAPGVFELQAGDTGACVGNAAVIDLGDRTVVVDTFMTLEAADDLVDAVAGLTGRPAFLAVNTHWHGDHVGGNQHFAGVPIAGTRRTLELIVADAPAGAAAYADEIDGYLAWARRLADDAASDEERQRAARALGTAEALLRGRDRFRLTLPSLLIEERCEVAGDRTATLLTYGGGHTESDVFVHVPGAGAVVCGDLLWVGGHPRTNDGDPGAWAGILDRIALLGATTFVPGHGPPGGPGDVAAMARYLEAVDAAVRSGADPEAAPLPAGSEDWEGRARYADGVRALRSRS